MQDRIFLRKDLSSKFDVYGNRSPSDVIHPDRKQREKTVDLTNNIFSVVLRYAFDIIYVTWFVHVTSAFWSKMWWFYISVSLKLFYQGLICVELESIY